MTGELADQLPVSDVALVGNTWPDGTRREPGDPAESNLRQTLDVLADDGLAIDRTSISVVRRDSLSVVYRGRRDGVRQTVLVAVSAAERPPPEFNRRAEQVFALREWLDTSFAPVPRQLIRVSGSVSILLDDTGGVAMQRAPGSPAALREFLELATGLLEALSRMHARDVVHLDLRPLNLLVTADSRVSVTGFGGGARVGLEHASHDAPSISRESWPYMSPEQTGRMSRPVDARSDLYSAGVVLYDLLTGTLPFAADDAMGWAHQHIAVAPAAPSELDATIPRQISRIVLRLLAKTPESRYQTADGAAHDLRRCQAQWLATGTIDEFPLGDQDVPDQLLVAGQLYGREAEVAALLGAYARVVETGVPGLVLVSGYSGIGKSTVVSALQASLVRQRGLFVSGKFEQHKGDIPYATLAQALKPLVVNLLGLNEEEIAPWRRRLLEALGDNGQLVVGLVPDLALVIGQQPPSKEIAPAETTRRFHVTVQRFLRVFASARSPLVLFIDDLQWLDAATLALLEHLATARDDSPLLVVGAYRDNEVGAAHPLLAMRDRVNASGNTVLELKLAPLAIAHVERLLADTLRETGSRVDSLAALVHGKTNGNPFFVTQFIRELGAQRLLRFDRDRRRWEWDLARIEARGYSDNVADLMLERLQRLPDEARQLVQRMACLGISASLDTLTLITQLPAPAIDAQFVLIERLGLVNRRAGTYRFLHDRIQEAAYALTPVSEHAAVHLEIGRRLAQARPERLDATLFQVVNQLARGIELVTDDAERIWIAALHLRAARRAQADSAHAAALDYLRAGEALVARSSDAIRAREYRLSFDLAFGRAECEFVTGQSRAAERTLTALGDFATGALDRGRVAALRVTVYLALDESAMAIDTGLAYLREDGTDWPRHPSRADATREYEHLLASMGSRPVRALADLPLLADPRKQAALDVATALLPPAFFSDENLVCMLLCRMAQVSVTHGNAHASPLAYAYLGMVLPPYFGEYDAAFEFGQLGLDLVEHSTLARYRGRVTMCFGCHVIPWARPVRTGQPFMRRAVAACREGGDITYAGFSSCKLVTNMLAAGEHLDDVERDASSGLAFVKAAGFGLIVDIITTQRQLTRSLQGKTSAPGNLDDADFIELDFEAHLRSNRSLDIAACWYWIRKAQARFLAGDASAALAAIEQASPLLWTSTGHLEFAEYHFYAGLSHAACADATDGDQRLTHRHALDAHHRQLASWSEHCPANFAARASMLAAERARLAGDVPLSMALFEEAVAQANEARFVHDEALALELFSRLQDTLGLRRAARALVVEARDRYVQWGALAKARQLEMRHALPARAGDASTEAAAAGIESFDIMAVVRMAQAISSEAGLEKLMRTLMRIALAHSGAERGVLVRPRGDALRIEARARILGDQTEIDLRALPLTADELPVAMLHTAIRTRRLVLVDDARGSSAFGDDPYARRRDCRSLLCLPLVKQSELIGILYLENNLASHVFTPARVAVLTLLASIAAMSMDNASLEEKESLLQEVHHRVKNNLQLISSLLSLQAMRVEDPTVAALFSDSCNRLRSMALVHENLYRAGNFARVPMATHLQNLCAQLARAYGLETQHVTLHVDADDLHLDLSRAVSCGLIVNELVSNALKHAFTRGRAGSIQVRLRTLTGGRCELSVADDGVGLPEGIDVQSAESLGLQLVGDLTAQLHARLEVSRIAGTHWTVYFDADPQQDAT